MGDVFCEADAKAIPLTPVTQAEFAQLQNALDARDRAWIAANGFNAGPAQNLTMPGPDGQIGACWPVSVDLTMSMHWPAPRRCFRRRLSDRYAPYP